MMNVVYDNPVVQKDSAGNIKQIHWFCTHEAMNRFEVPGEKSVHVHPDVAKKVPVHILYVPEYDSRAINALLNQSQMAREEWCSLEFVPSEMWTERKKILDREINELLQERAKIPVRKTIKVSPKDLFINVCQHSNDRKDDRSCSVSLQGHPDDYNEV